MLLNQLAKKYRYAQIITHTDLDGYGAGAILVKTLTELGFDIDNIKVTNTDYSNAFPVDNRYQLVFLSDISISNQEDAKKLLTYANNTNNIVFWFDHHKSSIDIVDNFPGLVTIPGIRDTNASGAMLCWIFYQIVKKYSNTFTGELDEVIRTLKEVNVSKIMNSENPGIWDGGINNTSPIISKTPMGIILTDDYDRFVLSEYRSKYYMEAFNSYPKFERNCKSDYFQNEYLSNADYNYIEYTHYGKNIFLWKRINMLNNLKASGFIASFPIEGMSDIEMICLNSTTKGSMMFGRCFGANSEIYQQYNYGCIYYNKGEQFSVSVYCANPDNTPKNERRIGKIYDASDICKKLGGGGHPGAAGFVTDKVNFCNIKPLPKVVKLQIDDEIEELLEQVIDV